MKKIIVDTNIIFSCLLNSQATIGDLVFNSEGIFDFYSNEYMCFEIRKHWEKLKRISKLTDLELGSAYDKLLTKITFINEDLIPKKVWLKAEVVVSEIDPDDIDFVALSYFLKGILWTGDKALYDGLKSKRFRTVYNSQDLLKFRNKSQKA